MYVVMEKSRYRTSLMISKTYIILLYAYITHKSLRGPQLPSLCTAFVLYPIHYNPESSNVRAAWKPISQVSQHYQSGAMVLTPAITLVISSTPQKGLLDTGRKQFRIDSIIIPSYVISNDWVCGMSLASFLRHSFLNFRPVIQFAAEYSRCTKQPGRSHSHFFYTC